METIEERLAAIEHEQAELKQNHAKLQRDNADLKQKIELHTIAIGALVNKATLESINEKNDKIFQTLTNHDEFTNHQLAELREMMEVQLEGKVVGLQTEMRQGFEQQGATTVELDGKVVGLQNETRQSFTEVRQRFDLQDARSEAQDQKMDQMLILLNKLTSKSDQQQ